MLQTTIFETNIFAVFTGNKRNQVLLFDTYEAAEEWLKASTNYSAIERARAIKTPKWNGENYISLFDI